MKIDEESSQPKDCFRKYQAFSSSTCQRGGHILGERERHVSSSRAGICANSRSGSSSRKRLQGTREPSDKRLHSALLKAPPALTFERGLGSSHQEEALALLALPLLAGVVAQRVATTLLAAQTQALAEAVHVPAQVGHALHVSVQQGVDEEVH